METVALKAENLNFRYPLAAKNTLSGISFEIKKGEFVVLCGITGSGKSTLLRLLKKELSPEGERSGGVFINGKSINSFADGESAALVGYVAQQTEHQAVTDTVSRELAFGLENIGMPQAAMHRRVAEVVSFFGLDGIFNKKISEISGGQKQLVNLAAVTAMSPEILLLDEPTAQLDPIAAQEFIAAVSKLNREMGITVIMADHLLEESVSLCDKLFVLRGGGVLAFDTPKKVASSLMHEPECAMMPAAARVYYAANGVGECPLSVREGRVYLENVLNAGCVAVPCEKYSHTENTALEFKNVYFRYSKKSPDVLHDASFTVYGGEAFFILGGNGSGKTTALGIAAGLREQYSGDVRVFGKKIKEYKNGSLYGECLAYLPQEVESTFLCDTLGEELGAAKDIFLSFGMSEQLLTVHPYDLSGGEKQLAALAKLVHKNPRLVLLDEPTKGIDCCASELVARVVDKLKAGGAAVVCVTHDTEFAARCADRCTMFFDGGAEGTAPMREFFCENTFYTTAVRRMSKGITENSVTVGDIAALMEKGGRE